MESSSNDSQTKLVQPEPILTDGRKGFHNSDSSSGSSSRYGGYYRGSHVFNGVNEFGSKRSAGRGSGSHSPNGNHSGSFSPHAGPLNVRPVRDWGEGRHRRQFKSFTTDDAVSQNHAVVDGRHVRILQRPLPSTGRLHSDSGHGDDMDRSDKVSPDALRQQQQQLKRGHRKKTLSLNPEEREALENLVEEVIIDGLGEAIIDSDGTSSSDEDDCDTKGSQSECRPGDMIGKDTGHNDAKDNRLNSGKINLKDPAVGADKHHPGKNMAKNVNRSNGKDYSRRGRESVNGSGTKGVKDVKRGGGDFRQTKTTPPDEEKEKPNAATVRGVNIYPAQLKVAIKHMDSLPPRFLRRLQTGTSRTAGNESILAHLTVKSPAEMQQISDAARIDDSSISPTDRDRGKVKQNQLQETKKTIRNLLCDLDQYTDETVPKDYSGASQAGSADKGGTGPVLQDGSGGMLSPGMPVYYGQPYGNQPSYISPNSLQAGVPSTSQTLQQQQQFPFLAPAPHNPAPRMLSCEEIEREMLHGTQPTSPAAESAVLPSSEVAGSMPSFYPPAAQVSQLTPHVSHPQQQQQQAKKSQFSVDAPEFVSSYYLPNRAASKPVPVAQSAEPFYAVPPPMHSAEMGVQILHDNVHLPAKQQVSYPVSAMPPPTLPQSASSGQDFVDMPAGTTVAPPTSYEMLQYDQMAAQPGMEMMRNTPPFIAPVSVPMPLPVTGQGDGVSPMLEMDAMGYPAYQYVPGSNAYSTSYAPGFSQTAQPSYMPMPVPTGPPAMSSPNWMGDGSNQSQMTPAGWYPEYAGMPYTNASLPPMRQPGFEEAMYAGGSSAAYAEQQMVNSGGVEKWSYVARAVIEAGRQKVQQLLSEGANVMVILVGGPDTDNLSLVRLALQLPSPSVTPVFSLLTFCLSVIMLNSCRVTTSLETSWKCQGIGNNQELSVKKSCLDVYC